MESNHRNKLWSEKKYRAIFLFCLIFGGYFIGIGLFSRIGNYIPKEALLSFGASLLLISLILFYFIQKSNRK